MLLSTKTLSVMKILSAWTCATEPEGRLLQMLTNLLSRRVVTIIFGDHLLDLLCHQATDGCSVLRRDDLCTTNCHFVELNRKVSSGHARILRGARGPRNLDWRAANVAEEVGFEPTVELPPRRFSRPLP